jgi:hypothetical protein
MKLNPGSAKPKDVSLPRRAHPDQPPLTEPDETVERAPMKVPVPPSDAEPRPSNRPDLDWDEHED